MLTDMQIQALHDQICAAYFDPSEESVQIFEDLIKVAETQMTEKQWIDLCAALEQGDRQAA